MIGSTLFLENNQKQFLNYFSSSFLVFLTHKHELATKVNNGDSAKNSKFLSSHPVHVDLSDENIANKIYLVSKDIPLLIKKSNFAKNSACHAEKIAKLRSQQTLNRNIVVLCKIHSTLKFNLLCLQFKLKKLFIKLRKKVFYL